MVARRLFLFASVALTVLFVFFFIVEDSQPFVDGCLPASSPPPPPPPSPRIGIRRPFVLACTIEKPKHDGCTAQFRIFRHSLYYCVKISCVGVSMRRLFLTSLYLFCAGSFHSVSHVKRFMVVGSVLTKKKKSNTGRPSWMEGVGNVSNFASPTKVGIRCSALGGVLQLAVITHHTSPRGGIWIYTVHQQIKASTSRGVHPVAGFSDRLPPAYRIRFGLCFFHYFCRYFFSSL